MSGKVDRCMISIKPLQVMWIFLLFPGPDTVHVDCYIVYPPGKFCNTFYIVQTLVHVCQVTNSSVNFIVYFSMGSRFRATVRHVGDTATQS